MFGEDGDRPPALRVGNFDMFIHLHELAMILNISERSVIRDFQARRRMDDDGEQISRDSVLVFSDFIEWVLTFD